MKKQYALPALLALLFLMLFSTAFADTVTIGTGTSTTSYFPFYGLYGYSYSQQIYTQAQINASGNITKIRFYYVSGAIANSKDWVIYMGHTDKETFATTTDWVPLANLTQVFAGDVTNIVPAANNWMEITLQTPFNYNNTDNLVIAVDENTSGYGSMSWGGFTSGTNTGICYYNDSTNPDPASPPTANYRSGIINRIQLVFPNTTAPLAPILTEPADGAWALTDAVLKWQAASSGGDANAYDVYFGTSANPPLASSNQVENFYTPTLTANQKYYWKVVAKNEIGDSPASDIFSFNTPGANNLVESFEETTFPPPGWANPGAWSRSTSYKVHGAASAYKYGSASAQYILSTPKLTITNDSALNFWSYVGTATGTLQIVYSEDRETWTQVGSDITHAAASTWYNNNVDLSSLAGNSYYLGIRTGLQGSSYYIDMVIGPEITPEAPGAPTASLPSDNATAQSITPTFSWTGPTVGGVPTGYRLYLDTVDGSTLFADNIPELSHVPTTLLDYETTYYWKVAAFNAMGEGPATTVRSFTTRDDPTIYTLPWTEDFEGTTFPPINWARLTGLYPSETPATYTGGWMSANFANISTPPNKSARLNIYGTIVKYWLVTPPVAIPAGAYDLKFDLALTTYSGTNPVDPLQQLDDKFIVLISDSPMMTDASVLRQWDNDGSLYVYNEIALLGETQIIDLSAYTGTKYIAFYGESTIAGGDNNVYVDNVTVRETPTTPIFSYAPDALDFGTMMQDRPSDWQNVTVTNNGSGIINLSAGNISIIGTHASMFEIDSADLPAALGTGESVDIPVRATLTDEGEISATLRMAYSGVNYDVALSAEGMPAGTVIIGDGVANLNMPVNAFYGYSYAQSIYLQEDIDTADQRIEKISYYWNGVGVGDNTNEWVVYMGHTDEETFASTSDWIALDDLTQVYAGTLSIPATAGWITITLTSPFEYNNSQNLVIAVDENKAGYNGSVQFFFNTNTTGENRSIRAYSDTYNPNPANPPTGATQTLVAGFPNIMMQFGDLPTAPIFTHSPAALEFGIMLQNRPSDWQNVTVSNTGAGTLNLAADNISFVGTHASMFEIDPINLPAALEAGESVDIPVRATLTDEGEISAIMRMVYSGVNYDVALSAEGLPAGTVIIGDGISNLYMPVNTYYGYSYSQSIYRQEDIDIADQRIEKISYYWNGVGAGNNTNEWVVYMGHTDEETFASTSEWIPLSGLTQVFDGTLNIPATAGWITITLSNPFVYNNSQNLVIAVDENKQGYDSSSYFFFNTNTTGENRSIRYQSDSINPDPASPPIGTFAAGYPNIMMEFGDLPTVPVFCYSPETLDFGMLPQAVPSAWQNVNVTNNGSGTLNFSAGNISIIGDDATMFEIDPINLPAALTAGLSVAIPVRATLTDEGAISATLRMAYSGVNYDVELTAEGLPLGTVIIGEGIATQAKPFGTTWGYERSAGLYTAEQIGLVGLVDSASWYCNTTSTTSIPYKVYAGPTSATALTAQSWDNLKASLTLVDEGTHVFNSTGWHTFEFDTPVMYGGGNLIVAVETNYGGSGGGSGHQFRYTTGTTGSHMYWNVDNTPPTTALGTPNALLPNIKLHIEAPPEGDPAPPVLVYPADRAIGLPSDGFNLSWNADLINGGLPEYYAVFMSQDEESIYDEYFFETENTYFNPVVEGELEFGYSETWYWQVQALNAHGDAVAEEIFSFITESDPRILSLPHAENFDNVTTPNFPRAWTPVKTNTGSSLTTSSSYSHTPSNSVYMYNQTLTETMRLVTPEVVVPMNSIKLSFQLRATSIANYSLKVGTVDTPNVDGVFTEFATITPTVSAAFEPHSVSFANYTGTDRYIAFQHGVGGTYQSMYLDTVLLEELMPTDLAATTLSGPSHGVADTPFTFEVGVYNNGTQLVSNYNIHLKSDGNVLASKLITEALAADDTALHELEWTPTLGGNYQLFAEVDATGDGNSSNNSTSIKNVLVFDSSMTMLPVGDDDSTLSSYSMPLNFYYKSSLSEVLYYPEELHLLSGDITAIILKNDFLSSNVMNKEIKIYMAETEAENLSAGWLTDDFVEVFSGNVDFPVGVNQIAIPLTTPFEYNGGTLAVRYNRVLDTQYHNSNDKFFYTSTPDYPNRSRYIQSDSVEYDPAAPTAGGTLNAWLPNTTFVVQNAQLQPHAMLEGYVRDTANNPIPEATVTLTDERYSTITDGTGYYSFTFWEAHSVSATASKPTYYPQTITDIELLVNQPVTQDFTLQPMPRVTVSGIVNTNDIPGGVVGAKITLHGEEDHTVYSTANGAFSIPSVLGNTTGIPYTISVSYPDYDSYSGSTTVYGSAVNLGTITLIEKLWTAYNLVAEHHTNGAELTWDPAEEPEHFFWDFEEDDGGWESTGYGDWEWANTYPSGGSFNWTEYEDSCVPPTAAHSGTGLWGTKLYTNYSNSGAWSYLTKTVDLAGFNNPQLRFWKWNNLYGDFDYWQVQVNGTVVLDERVLSNAWVEKVVDLSAYADQEVTIRFAAYATTVVAYAGLYIDDVYIGPPPSGEAKFAQGRSLQDYSVYRMLAEDEESPENWTLLQSGVTDTNYLDTGFASVPSGKYKWAVRANYSGEHQSPAVISNPLGVFGIPQNLAPSVLGNNVTLTWTAEPGASHYVVYGSDDPYGINWDVVGYTSTASFTFNATNIPYKFFKVSAADGDMPSGRSK